MSTLSGSQTSASTVLGGQPTARRNIEHVHIIPQWNATPSYHHHSGKATIRIPSWNSGEVGEVGHPDNVSIVIPQWGTYEQQKHDLLHLPAHYAVDRSLGLSRYFYNPSLYRPVNYSHADIHGDAELARVTQLADVYSANMASKLVSLLETVNNSQGDLEELISLNPSIAQGKTVEDVSMEIGEKIADIVASIEGRGARQAALEYAKRKFNERMPEVMQTIESRVNGSLRGLSERVGSRISRRGANVLERLDKVNDALAFMSIESEVLRDATDIAALIKGHGYRDSIMDKRVEDLMGVSAIKKFEDDQPVLGLLADIMGLGMYKDLVTADSSIHQILGLGGYEPDDVRFKRLTDNLRRHRQQFDQLNKSNQEVLDGIRKEATRLTKENGDTLAIYRQADIAAQRYGIGDHTQNVISARRFFRDAMRRLPRTPAENAQVRRIAEVIDKFSTRR